MKSWMGSVPGRLRDRRSRVEDRLDQHGLLATLSVARLQLEKALLGVLSEYVSGDVLEAGAGRSPYSVSISRKASSVTRLDIEPNHDPDVIGDVQRMGELADGSFDTVVSTQVLEHVASPDMAMGEFHRVLRPGGILILSVPHLSMLHDVPNDFFRFTEFGLRSLCVEAGFEPVQVVPVGGVISLIGHSASALWMTVVGSVPGMFWPAWTVNRLVGWLLWGLDAVVGFKSVLPRDLVIVARRS